MREARGGEGAVPGFVDVPPRVYADDGRWIPEVPEDVEAAFGPDNPWFSGGEAATLVVPGAARMALFHQPALRVDGRRVAFFGFWETTGEGADDALFARAVEWAKERGGQDLYGPIDFTTYGNYRVRLSVEDEGARTFPDEPHNPATYPDLLGAQGFDLDQTYFTQVGTQTAGNMVADWKRPVLQRLEAEGYAVRTLTHELWMERLKELHGLADAIFGGNFAYSPLTWPTFEAKCGEPFIRRACPHTSTVALAPDGSIAGFFLVYPHYGPVVCAAAEDRVAVSDLDYHRHAARAARDWRGAVAKTAGVAPRHRRKGIMDALTVGIFDRGDGRYDDWYGALIRKDNPSANFATGNTVGARWYGLYRRRLG